MLMASCNTSFTGTIDSRKIDEDLLFKRSRRLARRMTSSNIPIESNGIEGMVTSQEPSATGSGTGRNKRREIIRFNIRGTRFLVNRSTLEQVHVLPSRLTCLTHDDEDYDKCLNEFYFDRNPHIFSSIVDYYAQGEMHLPENMCVFAVKKELEFWELDADVLASCCWNRYCKAEEDQRMLHSVVSEWSSSDNDLDQDTYNAKHAPLKKRLWLFMNEPHTSLGAKLGCVDEFKRTTRMMPCLHKELLDLVRPLIQRQDTNWRRAIKAEDRLSLTIQYLAHGDSVFSLHQSYLVAEKSVLPIVRDTCRALYRVLHEEYLQIWSVVLILMIVLSIVVLSLETVLDMRQGPPSFWEELSNRTERRLVFILENSEPHESLVWIEIITLIVLTFEFFTRLMTAPDKRLFCRGLLNIADLLSIIPIWVMVALEMSNVDLSRKEKGAVVFAYYFMMLLRMLRLFRLFKLVKHYKTLKILLMAIKASYKELILLIILLTMGVIIYANVMFFVEVEYDNFMSIPEGFWWAIITMTTVGYGDVYPKSALGQVIGSACAITGILVIALPVPVIANNFHAFYASAQAVQRMREREEKEIMKEQRLQQEESQKSKDKQEKSKLNAGKKAAADAEEADNKFPESLTIDNLISKSPETFALTQSDNSQV